MNIILKDANGERYVACTIGRTYGNQQWWLHDEDIQRIFDEVSVHGRREVNAVKIPDEDGWILCLIFNTKTTEKVNISKVINFIRTGDLTLDDDRNKIIESVASAVRVSHSYDAQLHRTALDQRCLNLLGSWYKLVPEGAGVEAFVNSPVVIESRALSPSIVHMFDGEKGVHEDEFIFVEMQLLGRADHNLPAPVTVGRVLALSRFNLGD